MKDNKTNRVFFSACLTEKYRTCAKAIKDALRENGIVVEKKIRNTKDIWARDYMPIQVGENKFMRYTYRPDYLWKVESNRQYITDNPICSFLKGKEIVDCNVVLDGGNVVVCGNKMILTEKLSHDNSICHSRSITIVTVVPSSWNSRDNGYGTTVSKSIKSQYSALEVKSEENLQSKSLKAFHADHPSVSCLRTSMADYREQEWMKNIPLYALRQ